MITGGVTQCGLCTRAHACRSIFNELMSTCKKFYLYALDSEVIILNLYWMTSKKLSTPNVLSIYLIVKSKTYNSDRIWRIGSLHVRKMNNLCTAYNNDDMGHRRPASLVGYITFCSIHVYADGPALWPFKYWFPSLFVADSNFRVSKHWNVKWKLKSKHGWFVWFWCAWVLIRSQLSKTLDNED